MSSQATAFMKLAADMKRAAKRKADESDSEDSIQQVTNRGNKLRRKAKYVREGQLAPPTGPQIYKKTITYNEHYTRDIISQRPTLYDEDGYEIDSEDDEDGAAFLAASEFYPYSEVRIEHLLAPLTAAGDLPNHPTLSRPFTSKTLTELTTNASDMMQKEKASLWRMKHLLTKLSGDHTWAPTEIFEGLNDINFFGDGQDDYREYLLEKHRTNHEDLTSFPDILEGNTTTPGSALNGEGDAQLDTEVPVEEGNVAPQPEDDDMMVDAPIGAPATPPGRRSPVPPVISPLTVDGNQDDPLESLNKPGIFANGDISIEGKNGMIENDLDQVTKSEPTDEASALVRQNSPTIDNLEKDTEVPEMEIVEEGVAEDEQDEAPEPRRMRTRAQANAASDNTNQSRTRSMTPESNESFVHPFFLAPQSAIPDGDIGLPAQEAEETRRLLQLYIQKQEEICRGAQKLYDGLLKADRLRKTVMKWAKTEAHVGIDAMSDGEDWYDKEEWGLTEDLKKGQDEEEEDAATTAKKTRTRRQ